MYDNRQEIIEEILLRIAHGEPLRVICREEGKPNYSTVYDWLAEDEVFSQRFARAREIGHDAIAEDCLDIADDSGYDVTINEETGKYQVNKEIVNRARLRVETRLKLLAKWNPKKYGDSTKINHADANGDKLGDEVIGFISGKTAGLPKDDKR